jgi:hypothetical protein
MSVAERAPEKESTAYFLYRGLVQPQRPVDCAPMAGIAQVTAQTGEGSVSHSWIALPHRVIMSIMSSTEVRHVIRSRRHFHDEKKYTQSTTQKTLTISEGITASEAKVEARRKIAVLNHDLAFDRTNSTFNAYQRLSRPDAVLVRLTIRTCTIGEG